MDKENLLTRVCTSCGEKKSLSAFLQLGGNQGTTYGAICSDCRRTVIKPKQAPKESGETSTSSGNRIGNQQKVAIELERKRQHQSLQEFYQQEKKQQDHALNKLEKSSEEIEKVDRKSHKLYIENQKQHGFLRNTKNVATVAVRTAATPRTAIEISSEIKQRESVAQTEDKQKRETSMQDEIKLTTIDFSVPFLDPAILGVRHNSISLLRFKQWLGESAPTARNAILKKLNQMYTQNNKAEKSHKAHHEHKHEHKTDPLEEFIEKHLSPSSKKR